MVGLGLDVSSGTSRAYCPCGHDESVLQENLDCKLHYGEPGQ